MLDQITREWDDLPPRVRGARLTVLVRLSNRRLTPACAGSTAARRRSGGGPPTYPRVCGEHEPLDEQLETFSDLPPRVRGALHTTGTRSLWSRLTPACAGSTHSCTQSCEGGDDLPPRVRGARDEGRCGRPTHRLTPACAGSTSPSPASTSPSSTYPRVCGEHRTANNTTRPSNDLPPRVRGAHQQAVSVERHLRLTPACAGSTLIGWVKMPTLTTYPRVCGEHLVESDIGHCPTDLPPRVRGARCGDGMAVGHGRLTPACAGSTS